MQNPQPLQLLITDLKQCQHELANQLTVMQLTLELAGSPRLLTVEDFEAVTSEVALMYEGLEALKQKINRLSEEIKKQEMADPPARNIDVA